MKNLKKLLMDLNRGDNLFEGVVSNPRLKSSPRKLTIRPISLKNGLSYQLTEHFATRVLHFNLSFQETVDRLLHALQFDYKQGIFQTQNEIFHVLIDKLGKAKILSKKSPLALQKKLQLHNRPKNYILEEGIKTPFLVELGVMNAEGKILPKKSDKFRQINRFLEMVKDILSSFDKTKPLKIIDFGAGKAYLTFALYHYLHHLEGFDVHICGIDLKEDVILFAQSLAKKLEFKGLHFELGDINGYSTKEQVDMVVSLHACDTATDAALEKAVKWEAKVILAVPCCQHELNSQVKCDELDSLLRHGILKERFAALVTDAARAEILEMMGYKTQILEFIDLEHTPKNLLIRAVKRDPTAKLNLNPIEAKKRYACLQKHLNIHPSIARRLTD